MKHELTTMCPVHGRQPGTYLAGESCPICARNEPARCRVCGGLLYTEYGRGVVCQDCGNPEGTTPTGPPEQTIEHQLSLVYRIRCVHANPLRASEVTTACGESRDRILRAWCRRPELVWVRTDQVEAEPDLITRWKDDLPEWAYYAPAGAVHGPASLPEPNPTTTTVPAHRPRRFYAIEGWV